MKLELRNVGIIKSASLEFVPGLNLILGPSSSGKSTLLRALRSFVDNSFGDSNVTTGQSKMVVQMQLNNETYSYARDLSDKEHKSKYLINQDMYVKVGRAALPELRERLKLFPVDLNGESLSFNFCSQFDGPFIILGSPSLLYTILTYRNSFNIGKLQDLYKEDVKQNRAAVNFATSLLESNTAALADTKELMQVFEVSKDFYGSYTRLSRKSADRSQVVMLQDRMSKYAWVGLGAQAVDAFDPSKFDTARSKVSEGLLLGKELEKFRKYSEVAQLQEFLNEHTFKVTLSLRDTLKEVSGLVSRHALLASLPTPDLSLPSHVDRRKAHTGLSQITSRYSVLSEIVSDNVKLFDKLSVDISQASKELDEFKSCPLCGSSLHKD